MPFSAFRNRTRSSSVMNWRRSNWGKDRPATPGSEPRRFGWTSPTNSTSGLRKSRSRGGGVESLFLADGKGMVFKPVGPDDIEGLPCHWRISRERTGRRGHCLRRANGCAKPFLAIAYASHPVAKAQGLGELHHDPLFGWTLITEKGCSGGAIGIRSSRREIG